MDIHILEDVKSNVITNYNNEHSIKILLDDKQYIVIISEDNIDTPIVIDNSLEQVINSKKYTYSKFTGYIYASSSNNTLHRIIAEKNGFDGLDNKSLSVDHINWFKLDNRSCNLRMATQSQQNSNRASRLDKKKPHKDLINIGVDELPRHVRWDNSEQKFIIEKHPVLLQEVIEGLRRKPQLSGTKKQDLSIVEKYNDIIDKLNVLDLRHDNDEYKEFVIKRDNLRNEYMYITEFVKAYFITL